ADLVELHRGQAYILVVGAVDIAPAPARELLAGQEGAVEILEAVHAADDVGDGHLLHPAVTLALGAEPLAKLLEREQPVVTAAHGGDQVVDERLVAGALEVLAGLFIHHGRFPTEWSSRSISARIEPGAAAVGAGAPSNMPNARSS